MADLTERQIHQRVNNDLRQWWRDHRKPEVRASFLSNAAQLHQIWPELFTFESKKLPYQNYLQIAVSRLEPEQKNELRAWAEEKPPRQEALCQEIRERASRRCHDGVGSASKKKAKGPKSLPTRELI
jgi:hypothetical protein